MSGTDTDTVVPAPGCERTVNRPPTSSARSVIDSIPYPAAARSDVVSNPTPSSATSSMTSPSATAKRTVARNARACLTTFCRPSWAIR